MTIIFFVFHLFFFIFLSLICFTVPGSFLLQKSRLKFSFWEKIILGTSTGLIIFSLLSYLLSVIKLNFLIVPLIVLVNFFAARSFWNLIKTFTFHSRKRLIIALIVFLTGIIGQLLIIAPSGIYSNGDLIFWSSHGHDGLWHLSLMEEYKHSFSMNKKGFPLQNPVFAGEKLVNYHFFSDIAPAAFSHYFNLSALDLYFRFFPLLFSFLLGALAYLLGVRVGGNFLSGIWAAIFTYFAGSFGYIVTYLQNHTIGGESLFWASQVQSSSGNPPQIVAFVIILTFLYLFSFLIKGSNKILFLICAILAGSLIEFKVYGGVILLLSLIIVGIWQIVKERKFQIISLAMLSSIISFSLYFPNTANSGSFLIFEPWWFIRTMFVAPNKLNMLDIELKRQTYIADGNFKRVIQIEVTGFLLFLFGNLGMRFLGLFSFIRLLRTSVSNYFHAILILIAAISLVLPLLFLQKGVASNTIQFLQYFLITLGILAGVSTAKLIEKIRLTSVKVVISVLIIIFSVPTQFSLLHEFYNRQPFAKISSVELEALRFLKNQTAENSVILTPPYNKYLDLKKTVPDIWDWSDTAYIPALSSRKTYLSDTEQVDIMGYNFKNRLFYQETIFSESDPENFQKMLKENRIDYIYFPKAYKPKIDLTKTSLKRIFSNQEVEIWQINI